jgi:hypothetical protein
MSNGIINLTPALLRRIINEERQIIQEKRARAKKKAKSGGKRPSGNPEDLKKVAKQTKQVDAKDMAHTIAAEVNHYKALQAEAARLAQQLSEINEARQEIRAQILEKL